MAWSGSKEEQDFSQVSDFFTVLGIEFLLSLVPCISYPSSKPTYIYQIAKTMSC